MLNYPDAFICFSLLLADVGRSRRPVGVIIVSAVQRLYKSVIKQIRVRHLENRRHTLIYERRRPKTEGGVHVSSLAQIASCGSARDRVHSAQQRSLNRPGHEIFEPLDPGHGESSLGKMHPDRPPSQTSRQHRSPHIIPPSTAFLRRPCLRRVELSSDEQTRKRPYVDEVGRKRTRRDSAVRALKVAAESA